MKICPLCFVACFCFFEAAAHGTMVSPSSRVYRVYQSNPETPNFQLAINAIAMDSKNAYYTWNQVSRNITEAVQAGLPPGFDYSEWVPNGQIASGGRIDPIDFGDLTHSGLDQVSADWPTTPVTAGQNLDLDFYATASHEPSTWDFWMTTQDWDPNTALNWDQMEFLGRQDPVLDGDHYLFELEIPSDRSGHHVLWVAWHRDDPMGEVFFSTSDLMISNPSGPCQEESLVLDAINKSLYHAIQSISCSAQISGFSDVHLKAGNTLELEALFEVGIGVELTLTIEDCGSQQTSLVENPVVPELRQKPLEVYWRKRLKEVDRRP